MKSCRLLGSVAQILFSAIICLFLIGSPSYGQTLEFDRFVEGIETADTDTMIQDFLALSIEEKARAIETIQGSFSTVSPERLDVLVEFVNQVFTGGLAFQEPSVTTEAALGTVAGRVRISGTGAAAQYATVSVGTRETLTGDDGSFELRGVRIGEQPLTITPAEDLLNPRDRFTETEVVVHVVQDETVTLNIEVQGIDVPVGRLVGFARHSVTGEPVAGAIVSVAPLQSELAGPLAALALQRTLQSDAEGRFTVPDILAGEVSVLFAGTAQSPDTGAYSYFKPIQTSVRVAAGETTEMELPLEPFDVRAPDRLAAVNGTVRDIVTGAPIAGVEAGIGSKRGSSGDDGVYRVAQIRPGTQELRVSHPDYVGQVIPLGTLEPGLTKRDLELFPLGTGAVAVTVTDAETGAALPETLLSFGAEDETTDADGLARFVGAGIGPADVSASRDGYRSARAPIVVQEGEEVALSIALESVTDGTLVLTVVDAETGAPIGDARVDIGAFVGVTDAAGQVTTPELIAGPVTAVAFAPGYVEGRIGAPIFAGEVTGATLELNPVTTGTLVVTVTDAETQAPLPGAVVTVSGVQQTADSAGQVTFADLAEGNVQIVGSAPAYVDGAVQSTVLRADTVTAILPLDPITSGSLILTVLDYTDDKPISDATATIGTVPGRWIGPGRFQFDDVPAGPVQVTGAAPLYTNGQASASIERATTTEATVRLAPILTGTVVIRTVSARDGSAIAGATVTAGGRDGVTSAEGNATVTEVPAGQQDVIAVAALFEQTSARITLERAETVEVVLELEPITYGTLVVFVVDAESKAPLPSARVVVAGQNTGVGADGSTTFTRVGAGLVPVAARAEDYADAGLNVQLEAGQTERIVVELEPRKPGIVSGVIADGSTGVGVSGVEVRLGDLVAVTDTSGRFELAGVEPGDQTLILRHPRYAEQTQTGTLVSGGILRVDTALQLRAETADVIRSAIEADGSIDLYGIFFDFGEDTFTDASVPTLDQVRAVIVSAPGQIFLIEGHTDSVGSDAFNQDLSDRRAASVLNWLTDNGIPAAQLQAVGRGETDPTASNDTDAGRALNRRVVLRRPG